ncbi:PKD-like family lipoprotein [Robertkochia solimangrovi]|uniref:PKD-like family lipoprotein n=1 Tax=Robertkochia solimangrovi TaxID=2213046 RepID=UPI0013A53898|nr:PKD-like family lipoprotein [Robertkochia solimangrovi]
MSKYISIKALLILLVVAMLGSCAEDLGNYDYQEINEVKVLNVKDTITAFFGEPFKLDPELEYSKDGGNDEARYSYEWVLIDASRIGVEERVTLGTQKVLDLESLTIAPGMYPFYLWVKDNETGVTWNQQCRLEIVSTIYEGWMVLNDVAGTARLDMVSQINEEFLPIHDVLNYAGSSLQLSGRPVDVLCYPYDLSMYGVYVTTEGNGTTKLQPDTFDWSVEYALSFEMLANVPTDFGADFIAPIASRESYMYKDGDVYKYLGIYQYRYGIPVNSIGTETFKVAPFIGTGYNVSGVTLLYDTDNKRFVQVPWSGTTSKTMPAGTLFDYNTGKDLIYMQRSGYNGGEVFAILKDPADNKFYLARMSSGVNSVNQVYYAEIPEEVALQMDQAEHFAVSPEFGYVFYNIGGKLYEYDFGIQQSKLMMDRGEESISLLKFRKTTGYVTDFNRDLIIGAYDEGSGEGTFEIYDVPPVNGDLINLYKWEGFGKVVSASYRQR